MKNSADGTRFSLEIPPAPRGIDAVASLAGGLWIVALAATHRMRGRPVMLAVGGWLLGRGSMGILHEVQAREAAARREASRLETLHEVPHPNLTHPVPEDPLDEAGWESFPASDPPAVSRREPPRTAPNGVH